MLDKLSGHDHVDQPNDESWGGGDDIMEDPDEKRVLFQALDSFYQYSKVAHFNTTHLRRQSFYALPQSHWQLLASPPFSYLDTLNAVDDAIDENADLANGILKFGLKSFETFFEPGNELAWRGTAKGSDLDKARSTIRQFYRDWSAEGAAERAACYEPVIQDLQDEWQANGNKVMNVLVPGAGLGRLVFELCNKGFNVEGNEISYHQLLASSYILNYCEKAGLHTIYPWVHSFSNHASRSNQLRSVQVPDVHPKTAMIRTSGQHQNGILPPGEMSMSASDFLCLYDDEAHNGAYDAVATVFFIDTAPNLIRYIETVRNCLKTGGVWVNLGPLLWHFENNPPGKDGYTEGGVDGSTGIADPGNVELTDDEVVALVEKFGFRVEKRESGLGAGYIQDPESMLQSTYQASHWIARKL